jgi:exosome complex RNA-binding protein Rrp4
VRSSPAVPFSRMMIVSRGHGTYVDNDEVVASVAGTIERVNKLVTVRALRTR